MTPGTRAAGALSRLRIDRDSPVPLYFQVERELRRLIEKGSLAPGDRIPNEVELAENIGLSRPTVRRAIDDLVKVGLVVRRRGVGTHVATRVVRRNSELTSLFDDLVTNGRSPETVVTRFEAEYIDARAAEILGVSESEPLTFVERVRSADGLPLALMRNWLPASVGTITPEALRRDGLYSLMRQRGHRPAVAKQRIGARAALAEEARALSVRRSSPLLTMERTAYDRLGRAIEHGEHVYRADGYTIDVALFEQ